MAYVENGVVKSKRTIWRLSIISDFFWTIINFIKIFFGTLFSAEKSDEYKKSGKKWDGGPGGGSGGGPYGGGGGGPGGPRPRTMSDLRADHNALPACGSCCGGG